MRSTKCALAVVIGIGLVFAAGADAALAQEGGYAPPPPPPPPAPDTVSPAPAPAAPAAQGAPPRRRRPRYRPSPWGRLYLGAGGGYLIPGGELGNQFQSGGAYGVWAGWRKGWLGFEMGYLGSQLAFAAFELPDSVIMYNSEIAQPLQGSYVTHSASDARLSHFTGDVKVFLRLFCSSTLFARIGANYTELALASGATYTGYGYQYGAGIDYRIRLGYRPDVILKLRAEVVKVHANLAVGGAEDRRGLSGMYMMLFVNLGWSPR